MTRKELIFTLAAATPSFQWYGFRNEARGYMHVKTGPKRTGSTGTIHVRQRGYREPTFSAQGDDLSTLTEGHATPLDALRACLALVKQRNEDDAYAITRAIAQTEAAKFPGGAS